MKPRVAMLAYACDPLGGGEHWLGWGWTQAAAQFCDVTLFTPAKARANIGQYAPGLDITPRFVEIPRWLRWCSERMGSAGLWWRKIAWSKCVAREIAAERAAFDIIHHTTFHTFRVPFYAASIGIPSVWGPVAGGERTPPGFESFLGASAAAERKREHQNARWLRWHAVQRALRDTNAILVSNRTTLDFLPGFAQAKCMIVPPNTLRPDDKPRTRAHESSHGQIRLIYAGNCVATRCLPLVLRAMREVTGTTLTIAGEGTALDEWRKDAQQLGLGERVTFAGNVSRERLVQLYDEADALVFPALRDSGGSALLEAMSIGLPVICLDWAGPGEMVDEASGIKIPVRDPAQVIHDLTAALQLLRDNPATGERLASAAARRAGSLFTWEAKRALIEETYHRIRE